MYKNNIQTRFLKNKISNEHKTTTMYTTYDIVKRKKVFMKDKTTKADKHSTVKM